MINVTAKIFIVFFVSALLMSLTTEVNGEYGIIEGGKLLIIVVTAASSIAYAVIIGKADSKRTIKGAHYKELTLRALLMAFLPGILYMQGHEAAVLLLIPFAYSVFGLFFDPIYNYHRGHADVLGYVGTESTVDRLVRWINKIPLFKKLYPLWYVTVEVTITTLTFLTLLKYYL